MKMKKWKPYVFMIILTEAVGALAGWLTREGVKAFSAVPKSQLTPPNIVFPIVWSVLFALMGIGAARIILSPPSQYRTRAIGVFAVQLAVNFFWSLYFFNLQAYGFSFIWLVFLWILIGLMILLYSKADRIAAWLQVPYIVWVTFAGYLNLVVWFFNR